jgi:hypothetical protein
LLDSDADRGVLYTIKLHLNFEEVFYLYKNNYRYFVIFSREKKIIISRQILKGEEGKEKKITKEAP